MAFGLSTDEVRYKAGVKSTDISDTIVNQFITEAESEAEQFLKTKYAMTTKTEKHFLQFRESFVMLTQTPIATVLTIVAGGTDGTKIDPSSTILDRNTGKLILSTEGTKTEFEDGTLDYNTIKYQYANFDESGTETALSAASGTGASVAMAVDSDAEFAVADNVLVSSIEGQEEITTLTGTGGGADTLTAPLRWTHSSGSRVVKMQIPQMVKTFALILAGIKTANYMVGSTFTLATSYAIPEHQVTKGVAYTHFERVLRQLVSDRDFYMKKLRPQWAIG